MTNPRVALVLAIVGILAAVALVVTILLLPLIDLELISQHYETVIVPIHTILVLATTSAFVAFHRATHTRLHATFLPVIPVYTEYIWLPLPLAYAAVLAATLMPFLSRSAYELEVLLYVAAGMLASHIFINLFALVASYALAHSLHFPAWLIAITTLIPLSITALSFSVVVGAFASPPTPSMFLLVAAAYFAPHISLSILAIAFAAHALQSLRQREAAASDPANQP